MLTKIVCQLFFLSKKQKNKPGKPKGSDEKQHCSSPGKGRVSGSLLKDWGLDRVSFKGKIEFEA